MSSARTRASLHDGYAFQLRSSLRIMKAMRKAPLAAAAAAVGFRSPRALRAGVRVMAYLIEEDGSSDGLQGLPCGAAALGAAPHRTAGGGGRQGRPERDPVGH